MGITSLHHFHIKVADLEQSSTFCADFGLREVSAEDGRIYFRCADAHSYQVVLEVGETAGLVALAFDVESRDDLDRAVALHGAKPCELRGPGGGDAVSLMDPDGNSVLLVHGGEQRPHDDLPPAQRYNQGAEKTRWGERQSTTEIEPALLLRLGHIGIFVRDFKATAAWYQEVLGLLPSDVMWSGSPDNPIAGFLRIDRGEEWVDHHVLALIGFGKSDLHHVSFEMQNAHAQFVAARWMRRQGHEHIWGIGRHPKGSHVFDLWRDPNGYRFETFSDTDVLNANSPTDVFDMMSTEMDMWTDRDAMDYFR